MTEVDMLLRDTLTDRADTAPNGAGLLTRVHTRSRLIRRRRRVGAAGAGVAAVLLGVAAVPVAQGLLPGAGGAPENFGGPAATRPVGTPEPSVSGAPAGPPAAVTAVLGAPDFTVPKVPFTAPTGVIEGLAPAVGLYSGHAMIMHSATGDDADSKPFLMLYIDATMSTEGIPGQQSAVRVRGVDGTVFTPTDQGPGPYVFWTETDGTPMYIVGRNIPVEKLVAYANGLTRGDTPVPVPFAFTLLPKGLELDNVDAGGMVFKVAGQPSSADFTYKLGFLLNADGGGDTSSWPLRVGGRKAQWSPQDDGSRMLMISQPNGHVLSIQVPVNIKISDDDVLRVAAGVTVNGSAKAGRG